MARKVLKQGALVLNGRYRILKVIHTKGMANVYLAEDTSLNKQWCLKEIVLSELKDDLKSKREYSSLLREANIMKDLNHANIPRIVNIEDEKNSKFIVMDYVDGYSIRDWMDKKGGLIDQQTTVAWMAQVCKVLIYLHKREKPIFYRDMKPSNIMVQSDGSIKLLDFGVSVVIKDPSDGPKDKTELLGTRGYAPPEQRRVGIPYDLRSDIYALGQTMYSMLTGCDPSTLGKNDEQRPLREWNPSVSVGLENIINKCIARDPNDRYQRVEEVLYALQNYDSFDSEHTKKLKKKIWTTLSLLIGGVLMCLFSIVPYAISKNKSDSEYKYLINAANQSGRVEDYVKAIEKNPEILDPYEGYLDSIKTDGVFDKTEENDLLNLLNPILTKVSNKPEYGKVAYDIGKLYWFYYEDSLDNCMTLSTKWFKDAIDGGYEQEESEIFYNLGNFKKNIAKSIAEAEDSGMYKDYWDGLMKAKGYNSGEIIELQINLAIMDAINSYAYRLKLDGVTPEEMKAEVERIRDYLDEVVPSAGKAEELHNELQKSYSSISASTIKELNMGDKAEEKAEKIEQQANIVQETEKEIGGDS